jgi:hypothetical protein
MSGETTTTPAIASGGDGGHGGGSSYGCRVGRAQARLDQESRSIWQWSPTINRLALGRCCGAVHHGVAADQRVDQAGHVRDATRHGEDDRVLELGTADLAVGVDRGERPDVAVGDAGAGADGDRTADARGAHDLAPASTTTRRRWDVLVDLPSIRRLELSSRGGWPRAAGELAGVEPPAVSTSWRTRWPLSMSHWMASVISSSPRGDGSIARDRLVDGGSKRYTPTSARSDGGSSGFSTRRTTCRRRRARRRRSAAGRARERAGSARRRSSPASAAAVGLEAGDEATMPCGAGCRPGT